MYVKPEPPIPADYSGTALRRGPEPCPPPECKETGDLLLLVLLLLVMGEKERGDRILALILAGLLLIGK